jgi:hypothetical protein
MGKPIRIENLSYKSGTNDFRGILFEFLRNSKLDATDVFANSRGIPLASFKRNQFGASVGGPVTIPKVYNGRNRTFFFFAYEGLRQRSAANLLNSVPTAEQRARNFTRTFNSAGALINIYDPATTTRVANAFTRQLFPGNLRGAGWCESGTALTISSADDSGQMTLSWPGPHAGHIPSPSPLQPQVSMSLRINRIQKNQV